MPDDVVVGIGADAKRAEAEFDKINSKLSKQSEELKKLKEQSKSLADGLTSDFTKIGGSMQAADNNLMRLQLGMAKLKASSAQYFVTMDSSARLTFPSIGKNIGYVGEKTDSLIGKTAGFVASLGLAYKASSALLDNYKEIIDLENSSKKTVNSSVSTALIGGGLKKSDYDKASAVIGSIADQTSGSLQNSSNMTEKFLSGGVPLKNMQNFKSAFMLSNMTGNKNPGGIAEALMTGLKKRGINPENATEQDVKKEASLIFGAYGNESEQAINAYKGISNKKLSNEDRMALVSLAKENNAGDIRASVADVEMATKNGLNSNTYKMLGTTKEAVSKRKANISSGGGFDEASNIYSSSIEGRTQKLKTRQDISRGQNGGLTLEEKEMLNRDFNSDYGLPQVFKRMTSFLGEDASQSINDFMQDPYGMSGMISGKSLQTYREEYHQRYLESSSKQMDIHLHSKAINKDGDTKAVK